VNTDLLREVAETLAAWDRPPCSEGERRAAEWLTARFKELGVDEVSLEEEPGWGSFPPTLTALAGLSFLGAVTSRKHRIKGPFISAVALAGLVDEVQNGPRIVRRLFRRRQTTTNVVTRVGDAGASKTLVVLAHHDAAQTGAFFDQRLAQTIYDLAPDLMTRAKTQPPQWWIGVAPPLLTLASSLTGSRRLRRWAIRLSLVGLATIADIARSPVVPGANDNLSAVAALVALAQALQESPINDLRVLLVSCGSEEAFQDGIRGFLDSHRHELDPASTYFIALDTIGSPHLVLLEGEGPVWMEDYSDPKFRDLVAECAGDAGIPLERGVRARASTDAIIPSRAGYPTAAFVSLMPWRQPGNYHLMTDVPANLDYDAIARTVELTHAVARRLGGARS
jgi:hypothetical protein